MTNVTIIGNIGSDIELRFTPAGKAVANFTVAESKRVKDGDGWKDGPTTWWRVSLWDSAAENLVESLSKGQRVIVVGEVAQRSFETQSGEKRSAFEVTATEVGPSLRWATAKVEKTSGGKPKPKPVEDPWGVAAEATDEASPF